ncbi:hypothetical protein FQR65_LT01160 [Abscondita terminalis]|nr:hypothetical protein FQR65_LT01160 [Abscondita terminalis]
MDTKTIFNQCTTKTILWTKNSCKNRFKRLVHAIERAVSSVSEVSGIVIVSLDKGEKRNDTDEEVENENRLD